MNYGWIRRDKESVFLSDLKDSVNEKNNCRCWMLSSCAFI